MRCADRNTLNEVPLKMLTRKFCPRCVQNPPKDSQNRS